jgi:predicted ATP-dependent endonuclease of OLD family
MDIEDELSLVIGKNNTGKTSILSILDKFLNKDKKNFYFDDFNIDFKREVVEMMNGEDISEDNYKEKGIILRLFIQYFQDDNLENIAKVMMDLDPNNFYVALEYDYTLPYNKYVNLKNDWIEFDQKEQGKHRENSDYVAKDIYDFLVHNHQKYFRRCRKTIEISKDGIINADNYIDADKEGVNFDAILNFQYISAKREVANKDGNKILSAQTSEIYDKTIANEEENDAIEKFKDRLSETDNKLNDVYKDLFSDTISKIQLFGGIRPNESEIEIISDLQHRELLKGNTTVVYKHDAVNKLPEYYNGLGYMNLISMIFQIEILIQVFKRDKAEKPADINLLFIEEPEAHTHPQMQYIFIKNIKKLLSEGIVREDGMRRNLQYIITTHSSHIVADSDFDDIKYLRKVDSNNVVARNLHELSNVYDDANQYQFLKQYLTISRAEIFFADKVILIEGDTERILLPTIMKKMDIECNEDGCQPLLSQNISIIEIGAYSQIFDKFIEFTGIKTLIITDIDSVKPNDNGRNCACRVSEGTSSSNTAIAHYFNHPSLNDLTTYSFENKCFSIKNTQCVKDRNGKLCVVYQTLENEYNARSFEDAFINLNKNFISEHKDDFRGLKNRRYFDDASKDTFCLATECIEKKTYFALDILYHSTENLDNWQVPEYIKEGLLWLKQD